MICIQPVGKVKTSIIELLKELLRTVFIKVRVLPPLDPGSEFYNPERSQYRADKILSMLDTSCSITLGVTEEDIYAPSMNFVFGQAEINGKRALISTKRLDQQFYGFPPDEKLFRIRIIKEAMHEIGHVLGLNHCPNTICVMYFSNSITDTDRKDWRYCPACETKLRIAGFNLRI